MEYARASVSLEVGGARIGIIGAIGDCYSSISSDMVAGVYFKVGNELTELVKDEARKLREEGCDYIIYSLHDGHDRSQSSEGFISSSKLAPYYDIELSDGYVDMVFEAHTHQSYVLKDSNGVSHMQGGGENKGISHAEIKINTANGNSRLQSIDYVNNSLYKNLNDHPVVDLLEEKYAEELEIANRYIGKNSSYRSSDELRRLIAKLYYEAAIAEFGDEYDIVLGGGFLSARSPYELEPGEVRYKDVQSIFPFDNELVLCSIKGYDLKYRFFETDNSSYYIYTGEYGDGIRNNIDLEATYYVMVDTYTSSYAPNRLTVVEYYPALIYARDLLCDYISAGNFE